MSHGTDALYGFAAQDPRRTTPQAVTLQQRPFVQNILANVALAFVATTCVWTLWSHLNKEEIATLAERFAALPAAEASLVLPTRTVSAPPLPNSFAAYFDGRNLRFKSGALTGGTQAALADQLVAPANPAASKLQARFEPASAPVTQTAQSIPLPLPRPARLLASLQQPQASPAPALAPAPQTSKGLVEDKATVLALISSNKNSLFNKLFGRPKAEGPTLAYAAADGGIGETPTILFDGMPKYDQYTAVYDISARRVYLPDGTELEAHSGLGSRMDDPKNVHIKMHGATPPHVYDLTMREALFHGVEAIRLTPVGGEGRIFGRTGLLAHTYMLGPRGDSNGCVSFKDYATFLQAFKKGHVKRMVVVARLA